jgi:hypothetical protein
LKSSGEVSFRKGSLVQIYQSNLDYTFKTERKLMPKWSQPYRVRKRIWNAYLLEQPDGTPIKGGFSVRRLHAFMPRRGSQLEKDQEEWEEQHSDDQDEDKLEDELRGDTVWTLLFVEGKHGIRDGGPRAKRELRHQTPV